MDYGSILLSEYLKDALNASSYSNAYIMYHRFLKNEGRLGLKNFFNIDKINDQMKNAYINYAGKHIRERNELLKEFYGDRYVIVEGTVRDAIIMGMGQQSVSENSMLIHPVYGIPYIPAQAVKGMLRSYYICEYFAGNEKNALQDKEFLTIFGQEPKNEIETKKSAKGKVCFYDAFPTNRNFTIQQDIMNNHYPSYYHCYYGSDQDSNSPVITDSDSPVPIKFNVLREVSFQLSYSFGDGLEEGLSDEAKERIKVSLIEALAYYGLGAKTSTGYGKFRDIKEKAPAQTGCSNHSEIQVKKDEWYVVDVIGVNEEVRYLEVRVRNTDIIGRIRADKIQHGKKQKMSSHGWYRDREKINLKLKCYGFQDDNPEIPLFMK